MKSERHVEELLDVIQEAAKNRRFLDEFLKDLLTPNEYRELAVRWQIVRLLADGVPQRTIAKNL